MAYLGLERQHSIGNLFLYILPEVFVLMAAMVVMIRERFCGFLTFDEVIFESV